MGIFNAVFYQPLYNLLIWFYEVLPFGGIGLAIIVLTIVIKGVLFPLTYKTLQGQKGMRDLQPKIKAIREKYKDDKEKQAQELMAVYKDNKVNPFASCLPLIVQLPIFFALYRVLRDGLGEINMELLYAFIPNPGTIDAMWLGIDLAEVSILLAVLAAAAQYVQVKTTMAMKPPADVSGSSGAMDENMAANMSKMMLYFMPAMTLIIGVTSLPGGLMLYWLATTFITVLLYWIFVNEKKPWSKLLKKK
jgi:YidC/Oxa1 family membrane protein insertase